MFVFRHILGLVLAVVMVVAALAWFLGRDFRPWMHTVRNEVQQRLDNMVDQCQLEYERAKEASEKAKEQVGAYRVAEAKMRSLEHVKKATQKELARGVQSLSALEQKLARGETARLVSGREATNAELQAIVGRQRNQMQLAKEKVDMLEGLLEMRRPFMAKLKDAAERAPETIARLDAGLDYLRGKIVLCREMRELVQQEQLDQAQYSGLLERAEKSLQEAHQQIDARLAEIQAVLEIKLEPSLSDQRTATTTENILAEVREALKDNGEVVPDSHVD